MYGKFSLKAGPVDCGVKSPFEALKLFITEEFVSIITTAAKNPIRKTRMELKPSSDNFWRYVASLIALGLVQYPSEKLA
jgi:hypothetical protein